MVTFRLLSNGQAAENLQLVSLNVSRGVNRIGSAQVTLLDGDPATGAFPLSEAADWQPGTELAIFAGYEGQDELLFRGLITKQSLRVADGLLPHLLLECREKASSMAASSNSTVFTDCSDADLIGQLAGAHGLRATVAGPADVHPALVQYQCSDWDFLLRRAAANGLVVLSEGDALTVAAPALAAPPQLTLTYGVNLQSCSLERAADAVLRGTVRLPGSAQARPGSTVELTGLGARFGGLAYVAEVRHLLADGDWTTELGLGLAAEALGTPATNEALSAEAAPAPELLPGMAGLLRGTVQQRDADPAGEFRVKVTVPALQAQPLWARLSQPWASAGSGSSFFPEVGDEVILGFFQPELQQPVVLGSLYSRERPPAFPPTAQSRELGWVTPGQLRLSFDEASKTITLRTPGGNQVQLSDQAQTLTLTDAQQNQVALSPDGILLDSASNICLRARQDILLEASGSITAKAAADVKLQGLNLTGSAQLQLSLNASASAELSASGEVKIQGAMVLIN